MAFGTLTVKLIDNAATTVTLTIPTTDFQSAQSYVQNMSKGGGFFDNSGVWHPSSAILSVTIT